MLLRRAIAVVAFFLSPALWAASPDVVLISLDTLRADRLATYGGDPRTTPELNRWAQGAVVFSRCVTPAPLTLPAHATLLTGCNPGRTLLHDNGFGTLNTKLPTLAGLFAARGYDTAAVVASSVLDRRYGLNRGFGRYDDAVGPALFRPADQITDAALSLLSGHGKEKPKPLFVWVHYFDAHAPYPSPEGFRSVSKDPYDRAVSFLDREVGRLLKALPKGTVVAVVSDHGEGLGDHGEPTHGVLLYRSTVHCIWLLKGASPIPPERAKTACSLADVAPTLLAAAGAAPEKTFQPDGVDLLAKSDPGARVFPLETWLPYDDYRWSPLLAVTDGRFKWIRSSGNDRLFDLEKDPGERRNLATDPPKEALTLREKLPPFPTAGPPAEGIDQNLKGLGYAAVPGGGPLRSRLPDPHDRIPILALLREGRSLRAKGDMEKASLLFARVVREDPGNPAAWFEDGETLRRMGKKKTALTALNRALAVAPRLSEALTAKGHILASLGKVDEAAAAYREALGSSPNAVGALNPLAAYYLDRNEPEKAFPLLERAVSRGFADHKTFLLEGRIALVQEKPDEALSDFETALRLSPNPAETLKAEADIYLVMKKLPEAVKFYRAGIERYPTFAPNYLTLATLYLQLDEPARALPLFKKALTCPLDDKTRGEVSGFVADLSKGLEVPGH